MKSNIATNALLLILYNPHNDTILITKNKQEKTDRAKVYYQM